MAMEEKGGRRHARVLDVVVLAGTEATREPYMRYISVFLDLHEINLFY